MPATVLYPVNELKIGGAEQQLLELVKRLNMTRFRPIVAPLYGGGALDSEFRQIPGLEIVDLYRRGKTDPSPLWRIARLLHQRRIDIIQPFLSPATFFGLFPALMTRTPVTIVTERCGVRNDRGIGYRTYRTIEDWLSRFASRIVPNSQAGAEMLLARGLPDKKIQVIYNGVNEDRLLVDATRVDEIRQRLGVGDDGYVVGILASLTRPKGHDVLLQAVGKLSAELPRLRLAVIGDGPERSRLESLATEFGIKRNVVFFGYQRSVANYLAACDLLVSASRDNEGCSNSILEAMALRVPIVATDVGGNRELVHDGNTGILVPAAESMALALAIRRAVCQPDDLLAMATRAREMINSKFSLARMVRDYEALYDHLLTFHKSRSVEIDRNVSRQV